MTLNQECVVLETFLSLRRKNRFELKGILCCDYFERHINPANPIETRLEEIRHIISQSSGQARMVFFKNKVLAKFPPDDPVWK